VRIGLFSAAVGLAVVLGGCAIVDSSVAPRSDTVSRDFANARNEAILLNIVRAAHNEPLSFSAISQAIPQMSNNTSLGLPAFFLGPPFCPTPTTCTLGSAGPQRGVLFGNSVASDSVAVQTQFTLSTQETHDFYNALLRPADLYVVNFFARLGYPRELLFWIFADRVEVRRGNRSFGVEYNPPYTFGCPELPAPLARRVECFRDWAEIAAITGLSVEERIVEKRENGKSSRQAIGRVCFDDVAAAQGRAAMRLKDEALYQRLVSAYLANGRALHTVSPKCGTPWSPKASHADRLSFVVNGITFQIVLRSPYGIYQFLGKLLRQEMSGEPIQPPPGHTEDEVLPLLATIVDDERIVHITRGAGPDCFVWTHYRNGDYCVPHQAANTKRIIGLLAALTALQTSTTDLAITPVVHTTN